VVVPSYADAYISSRSGGAATMSDCSVGGIEVSGRACAMHGRPEDVFEREYDRLVQALTVIAGEREVAADAVQESFVRLVRRWDQVGAYDDPVGWVRRVALNQIRDHHRSLGRQAKLLLRMQQDSPVPDYALATDQELWDQLRMLPDKQRTALALHYVGDLTAREVAEAMNISEGTVSRHLHRALRTLKKTVREA
jgi:RNA polymerase sigma-70 factor (ECF subfamily)